MSVRRLAEDTVQPKSFAFNKVNATWAKATLKKYPDGRQASAVIPFLMRAQEQEGWVSRAAIEHVADMLSMPYIRVLEVATFYTQFQLKPVGTRAHVQVCGTTPCMLRGSEDLIRTCKEKIHPEPFHTNAAGTLSWEEVECLGACVNAPMVMIFKDAYEDLTPQRLGEIIDAFDAGKGDTIPTGPQNGRWFAEAATGRTTLKDEKAVLKTTRDKAAKAATKAAAAAAPAAAGSAAVAGAAAPTPPSKAAKPKTDAPETSAAINGPSKEKVAAKAEAAKSSEPAPKPRTDTTMRGLTEKAPAAGGGKDHARPAGKASKPEDAASFQTKSPPVAVAPAKPGKPAALPSAAQLMAKPVAKPAAPAKPKGPAKPAAASVDATSAPAKAAPKAEAKPVAKAAAEKQPELLKKPRSGKGDDLELIWGVGPKLAKMLNTMGIWHFDQIAAWGKAELAWVDERLEGFKGRASRDEWIKQAKKLATGWRPSSAVGDKPV